MAANGLVPEPEEKRGPLARGHGSLQHKHGATILLLGRTIDSPAATASLFGFDQVLDFVTLLRVISFGARQLHQLLFAPGLLHVHIKLAEGKVAVAVAACAAAR